MKQSLRRNLTLNLFALLVGTVALLTIFFLGRARVTVGDLTRRIVAGSAAEINGRVGNLTERVERSSRLVGKFVAPDVVEGARPPTAESFAPVAAWMLELMRTEPEYSAVRFTLEDTGEHVQVVQKPNGSLVAQTSRLVGERRVREDFLQFGDRFRRTFYDPASMVDNRTEDWYRQAKATAKTVWSSAYLQRNISGPSAPGVTCASPVFARDGRLVGVASIDLTIGDLSRFVQRLQAGGQGYAFLLEFAGADQVRILAHPASGKLLIPEGEASRLASVEELGDPVVASAVEAIADSLDELRLGEVEQFRVQSGGSGYVAGAVRVRNEQGLVPNWVACVVVPEAAFMASVWRSGAALAVLAAAAVAAGVGVSLYIAQRVSRPLRALASETERVRLFDLEPRPLPATNIREIDALTESVEDMKTGLRSFEKLVPAEYAKWLVRSGQEARLGGERRVVTTSFADLIGFTALSERLDPEELVDVLAEHLDALAKEVLDTGGTIDKFNGDDVMSFWGAPVANEDHARLACEAALRGQRALESLATVMRGEGRPALRGSFGIATGEVVVGNVGSRQRMNYTVIGDSVNMASRLQGLNRYYETEVLVSDETRRLAGTAIVARTVDWVVFTGREEPVTVHEVLALAEDADEGTARFAAAHDLAMELYEARRFADAAAQCEAALALRPEDQLAARLLAHSRRYEAEPPGPEWDPSERVTAK